METIVICDICGKKHNKQNASKFVSTVVNGVIIHTCTTCMAKRLVEPLKTRRLFTDYDSSIMTPDSFGGSDY